MIGSQMKGLEAVEEEEEDMPEKEALLTPMLSWNSWTESLEALLLMLQEAFLLGVVDKEALKIEESREEILQGIRMTDLGIMIGMTDLGTMTEETMTDQEVIEEEMMKEEN